VVSGDFYWIHQKDNKVIWSAADCTGHGVPGAFMSMLGNKLLHDIVTQRQIVEPSEILREMNLGITSILNQEATANHDGMDMGLCVIDQQEKRCLFAGANRPLVYVQEDELLIIKGNRFPIGGGKEFVDKQAFVQHEVDCSLSTAFYLFSDGFQDQFGGSEGRKMMSKQFRHVLYKSHELPMDLQAKKLELELHHWMNPVDAPACKQVDDILVVGFRV